MTSTETIRDLLTVPEVSALTGVPTATLRYWRHAGRGPKSFTLGGRRVVYRRADVDSWLAEQYSKAR